MSSAITSPEDLFGRGIPARSWRNFHPGWFGPVMGTAIVGLAAYLDPGNKPGLLHAGRTASPSFLPPGLLPADRRSLSRPARSPPGRRARRPAPPGRRRPLRHLRRGDRRASGRDGHCRRLPASGARRHCSRGRARRRRRTHRFRHRRPLYLRTLLGRGPDGRQPQRRPGRPRRW